MKLTPRQLKMLYPYQFEGPVIYLAFASGWIDVFAQLCADIDETLGQNKRGFEWIQIKEKFGSARFYFHLLDLSHIRSDDEIPPEVLDLQHRLAALKNAAEVATARACIVCGLSGTANQDAPWRLTLCEQHAQERRDGVFLLTHLNNDGTLWDPDTQALGRQ